MFRIDADGHVANHFSEGDPAQGVPGTKVSAEWLDAVQEEIAGVIEGAGGALAKANSGQMAAVLARRFSFLSAAVWAAAPATPDLIDVLWTGAQYVGLGANGHAYTSPTGLVWTDRGAIPAVGVGTYRRIAWSGTILVAVGSSGASGTAWASSPDGITWTQRSIGSVGAIDDIIWAGTFFSAVSGGFWVRSVDGIATTSGATPTSNAYRGVVWNGTILVAVGDAAISTSPDGSTWTERDTTVVNNQAVVWTGTKFVVVTAGSPVLRESVDGITWTAPPAPGSATLVLYGLAWDGYTLVAVGSDAGGGRCFISSDQGATWAEIAMPTGNYVLARYVRARFMAFATGVRALALPL